MSGYLQRLVATAKDTKPSLRPLLAPIFSPAEYWGGPPPASTVRELVPGAAWKSQTSFAAEDVRDSNLTASLPSRGHPAPAMQGPHPAPDENSFAAHSGARRNEPLVPERQQRWSPETVLARPSRGPIRPEASLAAPKDATVSPETGVLPELIHRPVFKPLLGERGPHLRRDETVVPKRAASTSAAGEVRKNAAVQSVATKLEPDEIHIQIGRIEVTAVEPASARVPRLAAVQGESLAEYLKRPARRA